MRTLIANYKKLRKSGMAKLKEDDKFRLERWMKDAKDYEDIGYTENLWEVRGQISGYLNAMAVRNEITLEEAIELYGHYALNVVYARD